MSMFKRRSPYNDLSTRLRDVRLWAAAPEATRIESVTDVCTLCVYADSRLFAVGTTHGEIRVYDELFRETVFVTPKAMAVRMLQFARARDLFKLLCIDSKNVLHVWNLDTYGIPPLQTSLALDGPIHRINTCLNHSHALLATQSGDILTFDLSSLSLSPYRIPYSLGDRDNPQVPGPAIDVAILPKKLQHVLIGYEDGAVLYDIVSKKVVKAYILASSTNPLTTLAIHPLGDHFAAGYIDGTIGIWDLHASKEFWIGTIEGSLKASNPDNITREPIFKMEWTSVEGEGDSSRYWLTVLGGQRLSDSSNNCVSVLGLNTASLRNTSTGSNPDLILGRFSYPVPHPAQDFIIIPPESASTAAHRKILLLSGDGKHNTALDAFEFPHGIPETSNNAHPEGDKVVELEFSAELEESEERSRDLATTLDELAGSSEDDAGSLKAWDVLPVPSLVPFQLLVGAASVLEADIFLVEQSEYTRLVRGAALADEGDRYRILITRHLDHSIRFHDVSVLSDGAIDLSLRPRTLSHLTIRVLDIPEIALRPDIHKISTIGVTFASESLECAVILSTGEVVVLGLGLRPRTVDVMDDELIDLSDVRDNGDVYTARFILRSQNGGAALIGLSDIGFLAVAFHHGLLIIVNMRGPSVMLRDARDATSKHGEANVAKCLDWTVSALGDDSTLAPRLLALRQDGTLTAYTLAHSNRAWTLDKSRTIRDVHNSLSAPSMSLVLDIRDGKSCRANALNFASAIDSPIEEPPRKEPVKPHSLWVAASRREIRCGLNITGEKVSKVNFSSHDPLDHSAFVSVYGSSILVTVCRDEGTVYSLPLLEAVYSFRLPAPMHTSLSNRCTQDGDLLQTYRSRGTAITVVFTSLLIRSRSIPSNNVNFRIHKYAAQSTSEPGPGATNPQETSSWTSWVKSFVEEASISGDQVDLLFAGPEVPKVVAKPATKSPSSGTSRASDKSKSSSSGASNWGQDMYQQLASAASERGERLGQLQEHFQSLEAGSKDLVVQAKKLAEREGAKRWFL